MGTQEQVKRYSGEKHEEFWLTGLDDPRYKEQQQQQAAAAAAARQQQQQQQHAGAAAAET